MAEGKIHIHDIPYAITTTTTTTITTATTTTATTKRKVTDCSELFVGFLQLVRCLLNLRLSGHKFSLYLSDALL